MILNTPKPLNQEWQKTIRELALVAGELEHGEIVIKVQDKKPQLAEYTIKRKTNDAEDFRVRLLDD